MLNLIETKITLYNKIAYIRFLNNSGLYFQNALFISGVYVNMYMTKKEINTSNESKCRNRH